MRLIEEKILMRLEVISIIFILLSAIIIQVSDHFIDNQNQELLFRMLSLNQKEQFKTDHKIDLRYLQFVRAFNGQEKTGGEKIPTGNEDPNNPLDVLKLQYYNGVIDYEEYVQKRIDYYIEKIRYFSNDYNNIKEKIEKEKNTRWKIVKNLCFIIQFAGIFLLMFGYLQLFKSISNRTKK